LQTGLVEPDCCGRGAPSGAGVARLTSHLARAAQPAGLSLAAGSCGRLLWPALVAGSCGRLLWTVARGARDEEHSLAAVGPNGLCRCPREYDATFDTEAELYVRMLELNFALSAPSGLVEIGADAAANVGRRTATGARCALTRMARQRSARGSGSTGKSGRFGSTLPPTLRLHRGRTSCPRRSHQIG